MTKIIDFETKGNAIRFYLGADDCFDYWGDDWNDVPYEHNAEIVYDRYCIGYADVYVDMSLDVLTPEKDWHYNGNSPFSKEDFKNRDVPCVIITSDSFWDNCYSMCALSDNVKKFWFEDKLDPGIYFIDAKGEMHGK